MSLPPVGVLMATYAKDRPEFLIQAIKSIENQIYPQNLISVYLAIDGPVPTEFEDIFQQCKLQNLNLIRIEKNQGLAHALNTAAKVLGHEEYIFRMDADDISMPYRFKEQIEYLLQNPGIDILGTAIEEFYSENNVMGLRVFPRQKEIRSYIQFASPLAHPTTCFRRKAWNVLGGYREISFNEDIDMWFRAIRLGLQIDNLPLATLRFRINNSFYSRRSYRRSRAEFVSYVKGIYSIYGFSWRLALPFPRLIVRLMPRVVAKFLYESSLRRKLLNG